MTIGPVESILIILFITLIVTIVCHYLKLSVIFGYILVGIITGPHALGWLPNIDFIHEVATFGVVLLMFTIGLEFSFPKLITLKKPVFILGSTQVVFTIIITVIIGLLLKIDLHSTFIIAAITAMSSTAIVLKQLTDQNELTTVAGTNATGILLFQDLAVIPLLIIIANLTTANSSVFWLILGWSFIKGIIAILIILAVGRWLLGPLFKLIATTNTIELFTLGVIFVAVGSAWLTNTLKLSYALGSFIAGIMLAECEYTQQIKLEIRPFRDLLLGLFFISIGMLVNISNWLDSWQWILSLVIALIIGKALLITIFSKLFGYNLKTSVRTGLMLAQGGEFGFALLSLALSRKLLPNEWGQSILAALLISFIIAPIIIKYNKKLSINVK